MNQGLYRRVCLATLLLAGSFSASADGAPPAGPMCLLPAEDFFSNELWPKVAARSCLNCHKAGGDAEDSSFVLRDPDRSAAEECADVLRHNYHAFTTLARVKEGDGFRLLEKSAGRLNHGGGEALPVGSPGRRVLEAFVRRTNGLPSEQPADATDADRRPFFDGLMMLHDRRLLRRVTLSLAGRLPTPAEQAALADRGADALPELLDALMREDAFYVRLREGFNDIFLTVGYDGVPENALSYEHFELTRHWYQNHDLSHIADPKEREKAGYKLAGDYRAAMLGEPMALVEHIVRRDRPFTEIATADYVMVTPYTARGYGVYEELKPTFKNPDDPFEYVPVRLPALKGRSSANDQESATGFYPHAGLLGTFQYLRRYPTTETNRNRLRARMFYQHFLGVDAMELAARVSDAAAVTAKYEIPTMQAAECVVCHRTIDPVAGLFQDYYSIDETYGRRKEGWYTDMFAAGFEGEAVPAEERWRALPWLGERTAADPRFAVAMTEHVYYILTGRKVLTPPKALDDPLFDARQRAYREQRRETERIAANFAADGFNLKTVFKDWIASDFYRADGLAAAVDDPARRAELEDVGVVRLLAPEQVERKVAAVFGKPWGKLNDDLAILYGGIDSKEVTQRAADPSGAMGAIERILANEVACEQTLNDFMRPAAERRLFPGVERDTLPGTPEADAAIREAVVHLHELVLGRFDAADSPEVGRTFALFAGLVEDARGRPELDKREIYPARRERENVPDDPHYTIRAVRGVLTYLLRRQEFWYE